MADPRETCKMCGAVLPTGGPRGRPSVYCSAACRQRAYRHRSRNEVADGPAPGGPMPDRSPLGPLLDRFIGRDPDLADLQPLVRSSRLVGSPGVGKTRLAHELAIRVQQNYRDGTCLVELAPVESGLVTLATATAAALGIREQPGTPLIETLSDALSSRNLLLVLDNCEHVVDACATLVQVLLARCGRLSVLATSREALRVRGEVRYPVTGLSVPDPAVPSTVAELLRYDAVRLFVDRARATAPEFTLDTDNGPSVALLCARLDGLPLAIELAASTVPMLPMAELVTRLDDRFSLLTGGLRDAQRRHQSLRAAIEWSYEQLTTAERTVFRRLSVLAGGFGLDAAAAVCADAETPSAAVLEQVTALQAKSLIVPVSGCGDIARLHMLESVRLYGRDQLRLAGEEAAAFDRLTGWLARLAKPVLDTPHPPSTIFEWVRDEHDNLSHALEWMSGGPDERQLLLAGALAHARFHRGNVGRTRELLARALETTSRDATYRGRAMIEAGWLAAWQGDLDEALRQVEEGIALQRRRNVPALVTWHLIGLSSLWMRRGDEAAGARVQDEVLRLAWENNDELGAAAVLNNMAWLALTQGDRQRATRLLGEALPTLRAKAHPRLWSAAMHTAGTIALDLDDLPGAERYFAAAVDAEPGRNWLGLQGFALLALRRGRPERALHLTAAVEANSSQEGELRDRWWTARVRAMRRAARKVLPADTARAAEAAGARLTIEEAIAYARTDVWIDRAKPVPPPVLSKREREVAELLAQRLTNQQVAARLQRSLRTVEAHVRSIRTKLGLGSREQVADWIAEHPAAGPASDERAMPAP